MTIQKIILTSAAAALLTACGGGAPDPSGDLEIVEGVKEIAVGDVINLRWNAKDTNRVYIAMAIDGEDAPMLNENGFAASGVQEFQVDPSAFSFDDDDDVDLTFKLMARDDSDDGWDELDAVTIEVSKPGN